MSKTTDHTTQRAKLFWNGRSQAVRLPKEFRFDGKEVEIARKGEFVILTPVPVEAFAEDYWSRIDVLAMGDDFADIEELGAGLLDPDIGGTDR